MRQEEIEIFIKELIWSVEYFEKKLNEEKAKLAIFQKALNECLILKGEKADV